MSGDGKELVVSFTELPDVEYPPFCESCGILFDHHNITESMCEKIGLLEIALADAIVRPKGVIPASAEGLVSQQEIDDSEKTWRDD